MSASLESRGRRRVENLLMRGEFPVEYGGSKLFFRQDSARIIQKSGSRAAFVLPFACFASDAA
jgi:hypothetical protein